VIETTAHFRFPPPYPDVAERFASAEPFPHIVIDDVLTAPAESLLESFPPPDWPYWKTFQDAYQVGKSFCQDVERIPAAFQALIADLSTPTFLTWLEAVTGIEKLIPDPYLEGGGLHCSAPGGLLAPHSDFHLYTQLGLYRRVNVLLYLNPGWREEWGGCLEFLRKGERQPTVRVVPDYGRLVVFRTDDQSVHGFSRSTAPPDVRRRSIALYYYTAEETQSFAGDTSTYWQAHGDHRWSGRVRLSLYRLLLFGSRGLAMLAHRANPNVGFKRRRPR
jgi:hypothetical protein